MMTSDKLGIQEKIDQAIRIFLYILIFWLPYSKAVIEWSVIFALLLWIIKRTFFAAGKVESKAFFLRKYAPVSSDLNISIAIFCGLCLLSVMGSPVFAFSLKNFFTKTLEWFIVYFLVVEVFKEKRHILTAVIILMVTATATAMDSIVQYHWTYTDIFLGKTILPGTRPTAAFMTANGLGAFLIIVIPLSFALLKIVGENKVLKNVLRLVLSLMLWSLFISFSRGALLAIVLSVVFFFALCKKKTYYSSASLFSF